MPENPPVQQEATHRGGFGTHGGESAAFIERAFREKIVLVGVTFPGQTAEATDALLDELTHLVATAGADVVGRVSQRRQRPDAATYIGKGKAAEILAVCEEVDADTVVFDDELSPAQQFNLEKLLGRTAIDRTAVILDIFAQNASSLEGQAQVELALLRYRLPRLRRGVGFSRQVGGIGTRGPGETQLEVDRRRIQRRIHRLEAQLDQIARHRSVQSKKRRRSAHPVVALVGYTNAGKSMLLNRLTDSSVLVQDRLFATLDAVTRRLALPGGEQIMLTDTVGFIQKLPHQLVEAFASTLDVVAEADLLLHVVDVSSPEPDVRIAAVRQVLRQIGAGQVPELLVYNKTDLPAAREFMFGLPNDAVPLSAATGAGVDKLLAAVADELRVDAVTVSLRVPFARGDVLAAIGRAGQIIDTVPDDDGYAVHARLDAASAARLSQWVVP